MKLYHGTTVENAILLLQNGWQPNVISSGANHGQSIFLYLTNIPENAEWFANQKGSDIVLEISDLSLDMLKVDPEDGIKETVEEELAKTQFPAYLVLIKPIGPVHFKLYSGSLK